MRDPTRIPRILRKLEAAWSADPDQRLNQMVWNIDETTGYPEGARFRFFHLEDTTFEAALDAHLAEHGIVVS